MWLWISEGNGDAKKIGPFCWNCSQPNELFVIVSVLPLEANFAWFVFQFGDENDWRPHHERRKIVASSLLSCSREIMLNWIQSCLYIIIKFVSQLRLVVHMCDANETLTSARNWKIPIILRLCCGSSHVLTLWASSKCPLCLKNFSLKVILGNWYN